MTSRALAWLSVLAAVAAASAPRAQAQISGAPGPVGVPVGQWREQIHHVPVRDALGRDVLLFTRVCRPPNDRPARVVLVNHGAPVSTEARLRLRPYACDNEAIRWFLVRGFVVVLPVRRGFGATGGDFAERSAGCRAKGFVRAAQETARDIEAVRTYATALPYVRPDRAIIVGQSAGGWGTLGYNSLPHPPDVSLISMAGGRGGRQRDIPHNHCGPDELTRAAGTLGNTSASPMLWIYTANDTFFSPALAQAMYDAFAAGGAPVSFYRLTAWGDDGHSLFTDRGGSAIWGPLVEDFLSARPGGKVP